MLQDHEKSAMVFFSATSPEHVTDLPAFNDFQMAVQSILEGHSSEEEGLRIYQQLDLTMGQILYYYYEQAQFQPWSETMEERSSQIYSHIDLVRDEAELALKGCQGGDAETANLHLEAARHHLFDLMALFAVLRQEEEARPKFSELAWVNELCRVAVACSQEELSDEHLAERLETAQQLHERALLGLAQMPPLSDRQRWRAIRDGMAEALESLGQGLDQVDAYLDDHHGETLDGGLELCMGGAQKLLEEYEKLRQLEEERPGRSCPMCSQTSPFDSTRCTSCSAPLPRLPEEDEPVAETSWPSHVQSVLDSLDLWQRGQLSLDQALTSVGELEQRFRKGLTSVQQMKIPGQGLPDEVQRVEETRARLMAESQAALEGLAQMKAALEQEQADLVNSAAGAFLQAVQGLLETHQLGQQWVG